MAMLNTQIVIFPVKPTQWSMNQPSSTQFNPNKNRAKLENCELPNNQWEFQDVPPT